MFAAASSGGVWKTTDGGASWKPLTGLLANLAVNALAVDRSTPNILYAGTGEGFYNTGSIRGAGIFKSTDGGANWARLEGTAGQDFYYVNKIIISPNNSQRLYAATRTGLWRSLDGGANWTDIDGAGAGALPDVPALCIVVDPNNRQRLFIGRDVGVFVSTGGGTSWVVERGWPNVSTETLAINTTTTSTQLFAFMFGGGAWRLIWVAPIAKPQSRPPVCRWIATVAIAA